ncbi:hypothetical protein TrRE_jg7375 [Triparma retinervis]|uniref:Dihydroxyacetone kinase n=1 Tax=Triparma retinervis TaxID=2557542 RepID=A0A9W7AG92_9STRA|nr:hypothetical protein TrRE_jg7375 [Triparma retinervis]
MGRTVGDLCRFGWDPEGRGEEEHMREIEGGDEVVVLVNNLGGTSVFEMGIVVKDTLEAFKERGVKVRRVYQGSYMTSFDMKGVSVTALVLDEEKERIMGWLDEPTEAEEWKKGTDFGNAGEGTIRVGTIDVKEERKEEDGKVEVNKWGDASQSIIEGFVKVLAGKVREMEDELTAFDKIVGDGDCGITMVRGVDALTKGMIEGTVATDKGIGKFVGDCADVIGGTMGGTSGGLLHILMLKMSTEIAGTSGEIGWNEVALAFVSGVSRMDEAGGAGRDARTMLDAIYPVCDLLSSGCADWGKLARAAGEGAEGTRNMKALAGRSNYVDEEAIKGTPDPGAWAVKGVMEALREWQ